MELSVISSKFYTPEAGSWQGAPVVARIDVLVDGELYSVRHELSGSVAREVSMDAIMAPLRRQIMGAIEQKLFNDFNRRDFS